MPRYLGGLESIQAIHVTKLKDKPRQTTKLPWTSFQGDARSEPCLKDTPPPISRSPLAYVLQDFLSFRINLLFLKRIVFGIKGIISFQPLGHGGIYLHFIFIDK